MPIPTRIRSSSGSDEGLAAMAGAGAERAAAGAGGTAGAGAGKANPAKTAGNVDDDEEDTAMRRTITTMRIRQ